MATIGSYNLEFEELGKGAFGIVYRGVHTETEQEVAVKKIRYKERGEEANEVNKINVLVTIEINVTLLYFSMFSIHAPVLHHCYCSCLMS